MTQSTKRGNGIVVITDPWGWRERLIGAAIIALVLLSIYGILV